MLICNYYTKKKAYNKVLLHINILHKHKDLAYTFLVLYSIYSIYSIFYSSCSEYICHHFFINNLMILHIRGISSYDSNPLFFISFYISFLLSNFLFVKQLSSTLLRILIFIGDRNDIKVSLDLRRSRTQSIALSQRYLIFILGHFLAARKSRIS